MFEYSVALLSALASCLQDHAKDPKMAEENISDMTHAVAVLKAAGEIKDKRAVLSFLKYLDASILLSSDNHKDFNRLLALIEALLEVKP